MKWNALHDDDRINWKIYKTICSFFYIATCHSLAKIWSIDAFLKKKTIIKIWSVFSGCVLWVDFYDKFDKDCPSVFVGIVLMKSWQ